MSDEELTTVQRLGLRDVPAPTAEEMAHIRSLDDVRDKVLRLISDASVRDMFDYVAVLMGAVVSVYERAYVPALKEMVISEAEGVVKVMREALAEDERRRALAEEGSPQ